MTKYKTSSVYSKTLFRQGTKNRLERAVEMEPLLYLGVDEFLKVNILEKCY